MANTAVSIAGVAVAYGKSNDAYKIDDDTLRISDIINEVPSTCSFTIHGFTPTKGQTVIVELDSARIFAGQIVNVAQSQATSTALVHYQVTCTDFTWLLGNILIRTRYANMSASDIAEDLITTYGPADFTVTNIEAGLDVVDEISFSDVSVAAALTRLAARIGGYWYLDYDKDLHFFTSETSDAPDELNTSHGTLLDFRYSVDLRPLLTRVYGEGGGGQALTTVEVGETIIPVTDPSWYNSGGGQVVAGPQRITYDARDNGGAAALVGLGASPTGAPSATPAAGTGMGSITRSYAYTWVTALGESKPSPIGSVTTFQVTAPASAPTYSVNGSVGVGGLSAGDTIAFKYTYSLADASSDTTQESSASSTSGPDTLEAFSPGFVKQPRATCAYSTNPNVKWIHLWASINGGAYTRTNQIANNAAGGSVVVPYSFSSGSFPSTSDDYQQAAVSGIAIGPSGVTSRKLYGTADGGSDLKLIATLADNSTETYTDSTADGSLGADAPTGDTSGLAQELTPSTFVTTGVTFPTNGAATLATSAAPVFTSASYNFVAADVGAYVYIKSGTNWIAGFYEIVSVAANAATLDRACASVASPTSATWGVDYSRLDAPRFTISDAVIDGTTSTKFTSSGHPVGPNFVGNTVQFTSGLGFFRQQVVVMSTSGTTATCDRSLGTLSSTGGAAVVGGVRDTFVAPGETTLRLATTSGFPSAGWAVVGNGEMVIRYTSLDGNSLAGIPTSGAGAITSSIPFNAMVTAAAQLTGVPSSGEGSVVFAIATGDDVDVYVQEDNLSSQAALLSWLAEGGFDADGFDADGFDVRAQSDGVIADTLQDRRMSEGEIRARCQALLMQRSTVVERASYTVRDTKTKAGKTIDIDLPAPTSVATSLTIQQVDIVGFTPAGTPLYRAEASSIRYSLEDLLRQVRQAA